MLRILLMAALVSPPVTALTQAPVMEATVTPTASSQERVVSGLLDLRPSFTGSGGEVHTENEVDLNFALSPRVMLSYVQEFQTPLYDPGTAGGDFAFQFFDGYVKLQVADIWRTSSDPFSVSYEGRLFAPTNEIEKARGFVSAMRNYFIGTLKVSPIVSFQFSEIPVFYAYSRAGALVDGEMTANPIFENRIQVALKLHLLEDRLLFSLPLNLHTTRNLNFQQGARYNDGWSHFLWLQPEITYAVTSTTSVGFGYYSQNLISSDFRTESFGDGMSTGVAQIIFQQAL